MTTQNVLTADVEYVALLDLYQVETLAEVNASDWDADTAYAEEDYERSFAWSYAFERNDEAREEMERDEARYGSFSELLEANR